MPRRASTIGKTDKILNWLRTLKNASKTRVVLVEHKSDADMLADLGIKNILWYLEPEYKLIDQLVGKECILLFDVDRKSNSKCEKVKAVLEQNGIKVTTRFRKMLFTTEFKEVGGILAYLNKHIDTTPRKGLSFP